MRVIENPNVYEAVSVINDAISSKSLVLALMNCRVYYEGRSSSVLEDGDRLVVIKQDGAVLVHRPTGYSPVNWQPSTSYIRVYEEDGKLNILAVRTKPYEVLRIESNRVYCIVTCRLIDTGTFYELLDESSIRDVLAVKPELLGEKFRTIDVEKKVEPGFIDLYLRDEQGRLVVVEIKRVKASVDAVKQLVKYVKALSKYIPGEKIRPILVAPDFTSSAIVAAEKYNVELKKINIKEIAEIKRREFERRSKGLLEYLH